MATTAIVGASQSLRNTLRILAAEQSTAEYDAWEAWDWKDMYAFVLGGETVIHDYWQYDGIPTMQVYFATSDLACGRAAMALAEMVEKQGNMDILGSILVNHACVVDKGDFGVKAVESKLWMVFRKRVASSLGSARIELGYRFGDPGFCRRGEIMWTQADVHIEAADDEFQLRFMEPVTWNQDGRQNSVDISMYLKWRGEALVHEDVRYNKLGYFGGIKIPFFKSHQRAFERSHYGHRGGLLCLAWEGVMRYAEDVDCLLETWLIVRDALAYIVARRHNAARKIQAAWKSCVSNPEYGVCKARLLREAHELECS